MNRNIKISTLILFAILSATVISCKKDEDFTHVSALEQQIHDEVNNYRTSVGFSELVLQFSMVKEAQEHSIDWSSGTLGDDPSTGLTDRFQTINDKLGGAYPKAILSSWSGQVDAQTIVNSWINDTALVNILQAELTQSGPGTAKDADGKLYVTHIFMNIPSK